MTEHFDVVIVGARCSGSPLALQLARRGLRVCVLDQARFPSDTPSTHIIHPRGTAVLDRLGVLPELRRAGAAPIERFTLAYDDTRLDAAYADPRLGLSTGTTTGLSARRSVLDQVLITAAAAAGADVRTRTPVTGLDRDRTGRVVGVQVAGGSVRAPVVVGADGRGSSVARQVGAREYATYPAARFATWGYFAGAQDDGNRLRIGRFGEHAFVSSPAGEGLLTVAVVPSMSRRAEFLADREANYTAELRDWPELADLVEGAERVGPLRVVPDWRGYFRESAGPGWVLTGDAGNFKDPSAAQGITDALRQSERLAEVLVHGLGSGGLDTALREWWTWRDDDCREMHWFAADMGAAGVTRPVTAAVVRGLAAQGGAAELVAVLNRDRAPARVLTPTRLARAAGAALRHRPRDVRAVGAEVVGSVGDLVRRSPRRTGRPARHAQGVPGAVREGTNVVTA